MQKEQPKLTTTIEQVIDSDSDSDTENDQKVPDLAEVPQKFAAHLNLDQFAPSEITVQVVEDQSSPSRRRAQKRTLEVRGRHPDDQPDQEVEYLEYVKRLSLPADVETDRLRCTLDQASGHLIVEAPLKRDRAQLEPSTTPTKSAHSRIIPVEVLKWDKDDDEEEEEELIVID
jgi:hypothetical protein